MADPCLKSNVHCLGIAVNMINWTVLDLATWKIHRLYICIMFSMCNNHQAWKWAVKKKRKRVEIFGLYNLCGACWARRHNSAGHGWAPILLWIWGLMSTKLQSRLQWFTLENTTQTWVCESLCTLSPAQTSFLSVKSGPKSSCPD